MKTLLKALALASASVAVTAAAIAPASAQSRLGVAVANVDQAVANSAAYSTAMSQMKVTYKATFDSIDARKKALEIELKTKGDALQAALQAAGGKSTPALQAQYEAYQKRGAEAQQEIQTLGTPLARANAYVEAQISAKIAEAIKSAMTKQKVDLVLAPDATVSYAPTVDITSAVTTELNTIVPNVSITPPAGWQPGQPLAGGTPASAGAGR